MFSRTLNRNNLISINPVEIANIFSNHFATAAENKHFFEYIGNKYFKLFFSSHTDKNNISSIISSLNPNNSVCPNGIPTTILTLLMDGSSCHLSDIYDISFFMFPSVVKTAKVIFIHKKDSTLDHSNYCPVSLLPCIEKKKKKNCYIMELLNF